MNDLKDEQRPSGELPGIVPTRGWGYQWGNGPAWDSAYVLIPWYLYQYCGDTRVLAEHYDRLKRYVDYLTSKAKNTSSTSAWATGCRPRRDAGGGHLDRLLLRRCVDRLQGRPTAGQDDDAKKYADLAAAIREAFNQDVLSTRTALYANGSQTALSCALYQGLVAAGREGPVLGKLVANVEKHDGHLDTGILGAKYLLHALRENGRADVAYRIATQTTPPSCGDWIRRGATTLWEDWGDGASRNHIMFGDISAWFYQTLGRHQPRPRSSRHSSTSSSGRGRWAT